MLDNMCFQNNFAFWVMLVEIIFMKWQVKKSIDLLSLGIYAPGRKFWRTDP